ncbi:MAG: sulfurtransferase TusA family protein, partial [Tetragenococcus halophilus]|nr:sulfurtransferase TusA family protein [Tetragenococcus halophilus]MDN6527031.1 sulfurtransferase TusA family protein [Tetragenococcus halophilus]MDN6726401.1 sulfurtransferase TusA family protein [Tetragenococcus halophilus]
MLKINALGKPCPIPVVETKKALRDRGEQNEPIEVSVDN